MNNNNSIGCLFFGGYKNLLPEMLTTILLASRAIYSCTPSRPSNTIHISHATDNQLDLFVCLCFTSLQQRGNLETAPPFTVPCEDQTRIRNRRGESSICLIKSWWLLDSAQMVNIVLLCIFKDYITFKSYSFKTHLLNTIMSLDNIQILWHPAKIMNSVCVMLFSRPLK